MTRKSFTDSGEDKRITDRLDGENDIRLKQDERMPAGTPRWVKVFGLIMIVLLLLVGILFLSGEHGPGHHMNSDGHSMSIISGGQHS